jgi:cytoskeletal protein CcmA (bactofilin family)
MNEDNFEEEVRISGSGKISGGRYGRIVISGSGTVAGDVEAREITVAGSGQFEGDVEVRKITITGSCNIEGKLEADRVISRGGLTVELDMKAPTVKSYGSLAVDGSIIAEDVYFAGSSEVDGDVEAESFTSRGGFRIGGLLTADEIDIWLGSENSAVEVGGSKVKITKRGPSLDFNSEKIKGGVENLETGLDRIGDKLGFSLDLDEDRITRGITRFGEKVNYYVKEIGNGKFRSSLIEGDEISLEGVEAETVRGARVEIGEDCVIDKVEYSDKIEVAEGAAVEERVRL